MAIYSQSFEGLDDLMKDIAVFGTEATKLLVKDAEKAGNIVLNASKNNVSKYHKFSQAGTLRNSLKLKKSKTKLKATATVTWGNDVREYAAPLELGHAVKFGDKVVGSAAPHPFLRPAADENEQKVKDVLVEGINEAVSDLLGGKA